MRTRTKIVCTIGPACNSPERIRDLVVAGMDVARLNFSHGTHEQHAEVIDHLKQVREQLAVPLAIMLDTKGPEVRLGQLVDGRVKSEAKERFFLVRGECAERPDQLPIVPGSILANLHPGMTVLFNDGYVAATVIERTEESVLVEVVNGGEIASGKGVNVPDAELDLPPVTDRDIGDLQFGCEMGVDIVAASFIQTADQMVAIRQLLAQRGGEAIRLMAKIESASGVRNFDAILEASDGIMIARGDLGVEIPLARVPVLQKMMIRKAYLMGKPSVTATQMLESMIERPRPTRAEASDVANAIYDSTSAVMLSGETAVGRYPIDAVRVMRSIAQEAEADFDYHQFFYHDSERQFRDVPSSVTLASVKTAYASGAKAIFIFTKGGGTARLISRLRPSMPIFALTPSHRVYNQLAAYWGVIPLYGDAQTVEEAFDKVKQFALEKGYVEYGDLVVVTAGVPFGVAGTTNTMVVESIGDVLVRGYPGHGSAVDGQVATVLTLEDGVEERVGDHILVITRCNDKYLPLLKLARGVILQNSPADLDSEKYLLLVSKALDLPVIVRANLATSALRDGDAITLDPLRGLVYRGIPQQ